MLDDPTAPPIFRASGEAPYHGPLSPLPEDVVLRQVTLRDRVTKASLIPFSSPEQVPMSLISYLCNQLNKEIEKGDTYPMIDSMPLEKFGPYWFANFGAVMILGDVKDAYQLHQMERDLQDEEEGGGTPPPPGEERAPRDWDKECLGSFYIKPNYPGRSSHVCNGGFLVTDGARNRGVGRLMGEGYLEWAPKLVGHDFTLFSNKQSNSYQGYTYSIFNLVYETNVASCRIWDALGFKRVGRVKGCGNLKSYPNQLIDAIIYGRDLGPEGEDYVSEERFEKIRFYLKHAKYPNGADRAEKSRLRSAATHYKLIPAQKGEPEKLMLKGKEVVSDPQKQYDVARRMHLGHHGGINKTTASIAEKYHWVRIKETVSQVLKNCQPCKDAARGVPRPRYATTLQSNIVPFNREFSVPPGENWMRLYGSATTPEAEYNEPEPLPPREDDNNASEMDIGTAIDVAQNSNIHNSNTLPNNSLNRNSNSNSNVPVDPLLMDGIEPSDRTFIETHFDITPADEMAQATAAPERPTKIRRITRMTRRSAAGTGAGSTESELLNAINEEFARS